VLNQCLSWSKFVNTHLYHSRQWFDIHMYMKPTYNRLINEKLQFIHTVNSDGSKTEKKIIKRQC